MFNVFIRNFTSGDEDRHFVVMPGGGSSEGYGSESTNGGSVVSMPVAVEVGSLQPFQVKGDPHSISHLASRISVCLSAQTTRSFVWVWRTGG